MTPSFRRLTYFAGFFIVTAIVVVVGVLAYTSFERRQHEAENSVGTVLYAENCASCHGSNLKGEAEWQIPNPEGILPAPPHNEDGHTWHHSDQILFNYIKLGGERALAQDGVVGFNSGMPAFEFILSGAEIDAVLDFIKSRWPEEIRKVQKDRTKTEEELNQ